ncbi:MAG: hypothetical protein ABEJ03_06380 [Candidatus Nanohaloarchaea archaeon]
MTRIAIIGEDHSIKRCSRQVQQFVSAGDFDVIYAEKDPDQHSSETLYSDLVNITVADHCLNTRATVEEVVDAIDFIPEEELSGPGEGGGLLRRDHRLKTPLYELTAEETKRILEVTPDSPEDSRHVRNIDYMAGYKENPESGNLPARLAHLWHLQDIDVVGVDTGRGYMFEEGAKMDSLPDDSEAVRDEFGEIRRGGMEVGTDRSMAFRAMVHRYREARTEKMAENISENLETNEYEDAVAVMGRNHARGVYEKLNEDFEDDQHHLSCFMYDENSGLLRYWNPQETDAEFFWYTD